MSKKDDPDLTKSIYLAILKRKSEPILYEETDWFVLLAKRPCNEGHLLIIPKQQVRKFFELPQAVLNRGFRISTLLSQMLNNTYNPPQVAFFIKGFTNDNHAHLHITPAYRSEDLDVDLTRPELETDQMYELAKKLKPAIDLVLGTD